MGRNLRGSTLLVLQHSLMSDKTSHLTITESPGHKPLQGGLRLFPAKPFPAPER